VVVVWDPKAGKCADMSSPRSYSTKRKRIGQRFSDGVARAWAAVSSPFVSINLTVGGHTGFGGNGVGHSGFDWRLGA
jgi:hypothetical protein